jgi:hypothetical protein
MTFPTPQQEQDGRYGHPLERHAPVGPESPAVGEPSMGHAITSSNLKSSGA